MKLARILCQCMIQLALWINPMISMQEVSAVVNSIPLHKSNDKYARSQLLLLIGHTNISNQNIIHDDAHNIGNPKFNTQSVVFFDWSVLDLRSRMPWGNSKPIIHYTVCSLIDLSCTYALAYHEENSHSICNTLI